MSKVLNLSDFNGLGEVSPPRVKRLPEGVPFHEMDALALAQDREVAAPPWLREVEGHSPPEHPSLPAYALVTDGQFAEAMVRLSQLLRKTIELHAAGKDYAEIASELGTSKGVVGKRLHNARAKLLEPLIKAGVH